MPKGFNKVYWGPKHNFVITRRDLIEYVSLRWAIIIVQLTKMLGNVFSVNICVKSTRNVERSLINTNINIIPYVCLKFAIEIARTGWLAYYHIKHIRYNNDSYWTNTKRHRSSLDPGIDRVDDSFFAGHILVFEWGKLLPPTNNLIFPQEFSTLFGYVIPRPVTRILAREPNSYRPRTNHGEL